jgi:hypothetical protein
MHFRTEVDNSLLEILSQHERLSSFLSRNFQPGLEEFVWFEDSNSEQDEVADMKNMDYEIMSLLMHQLGES